MKTRNNVIIVAILLFANACEPVKVCVDNNSFQYLKESELNSLPYKDFSELTFIHRTNRDTFLFKGGSYKSDFTKYVIQQECPQTFNAQRRKIEFVNGKSGSKITVENAFLQTGVSTLNIMYNNANKNIEYAVFSKPFTYDSLLIEGKNYTEVREVKPNQAEGNLGFLFTPKQGIIQLINGATNDTLNLVALKL